jgi:hypothetical protein
MTEGDWLACQDPYTLLTWLKERASERKLRLTACAACRRFWPWFDEDEASRSAIEAAEMYADGGVSSDDYFSLSATIRIPSPTLAASVNDDYALAPSG